MKKVIADDLKATLQEHGVELNAAARTSLVEVMLDSIIRQLETEGECSLRRFGAFKVHNQAARTMRNPRTGEPVEMPARKVLRFKVSPIVKDRLNQ